MRSPHPWRRGQGAWYSQIDGRKVWLAPKDATHQQAQQALYRLLADRGKQAKQRANPSVRDVLNLYLAHCRGEVGRQERTAENLENKRWFLVSAAASFGRLRAAEVGPRHVTAWLDGQPTWGQSTRTLASRHIKAAFRWAKDTGHTPDNPLAGLKAGRTKTREAIPTEEQVTALLGRLDGPFHDFVLALIESGCRPGELRTLTADRVDVPGGTWTVANKTRGKTGEGHRVVYLTATLVEMSERLLRQFPSGLVFRNKRGRAWTRANLGKRMLRLREELDLGKEMTLYGLRHRFATTALANHIPIATVATLLGHKTTNMVMSIYSKLNREADHLRDAAKKARGGTDTHQ